MESGIGRVWNHKSSIPSIQHPVAGRFLKLRYGLDEGIEPMTLKEIGKIVGLTRERVRQIERDALRKLHDVMNND